MPTPVASGTSPGTAVYNSVASQPADTGAAGGLSPYGTMGQGGNVWEWNETATIGSLRGVRGGSWDDDSDDLLASSRGGSPPPFHYSYNGVGFRVASSGAVPEPGGLAVWLGLAVTGLFFRKRRK